MEKCGYDRQPPVTIRRAVGWGDRNLLKPFVKKSDLDKALAIYRRHHREALLKHCRILKTGRAILSYLKDRGYLLAVASNRPTVFSRLIIKQLKLGKYFSYMLCGDKLKKGKPHPEILQKIMQRLKAGPQQTLYVGDMPIDAQAARRAGVKSVVVATGSASIRQLRLEKPYLVLRDLRGLKAIL